jgi:imidazolonepropionase-like amidohydrolase
MRTPILLSLLACLSACGHGTVAADTENRPAVAAQTLAIINGKVFDGTEPTAPVDHVVLVEGDRIVRIAPREEVDLSDVATVIDADGGFVMPGVIDAHVHVYFSGLPRGEDILTPWLEAGVTTLVDVGTMRHTVRATRALAEASGEHTPRLFVAGPILTAPGGYPMTRFEHDVDLYGRSVRGVTLAREAVADLIDLQGADLIKIAIEAGFDRDYTDEGWPVLSPEEVRAITGAAHERGRNVYAHVSQPLELRAAVDAGVDVAAHPPISPVPEEILEEAARAGMVFISTANIWTPENTREVVANLSAFHRLGGRIALGTDFPYQEGSTMPVEEMQLLLDAGLTPAEVLVAATRNGAFAIGKDAELGTLEPGKLADIIIVDGDPLSDLAALHNVRVVIYAGTAVASQVK